ncbi:fimbria/pilus periplasmic chaperone [Pelagicoccus sp. SDUM812003]|uniref:fimbrial biogenesis chaperone n=1 Tax=Pelagicoccus sp. SDUM812003 TaxID=3041267 RepID=UPI00280FD2F6|nr:fimbria/pilus periplasmic chaperone [Pelagicoccus sp. SDUM812003]MDQ8202044.1 fimbria/pilus periplasmic chaperone [Pelagicoccus sp. SDUM812003]
MKRLALTSLLAILVSSFAHAFSVSPMVADFDPNAPRSQQVFVLTNASDQEKPVEITVAKPLLDENGVETMDIGNGEDEFLIIPQQFVLPPNARRSVKVIYVGDPRETEDTYRIVFKELPVDLAQDEVLPEGESSFSMRIVMQYNTRIWLTPSGLEDELAITRFDKYEMPSPDSVSLPDERNENATTDSQTIPMLRFTVANTGPAHGYIRYPKISLVTKAGNRYELDKEDLQYVAGQVVMKESQKEFKIRWQDDFPDIVDIERIDLVTKKR